MASLDIEYSSHWYLSYHRGLNKQSLLPIEAKGKLRLTGWTGSSCELYAILSTRLPWLGLPNIEPAVVNTSCVELEQEAENSFEETAVLIKVIELTLVCVVTPVPCKLWLDCIWVRQPSTMHSLIIIHNTTIYNVTLFYNTHIIVCHLWPIKLLHLRVIM